MLKIYLIVNAISYILFSLWCVIKANSTAKNLGYSFLNNSGKIEYLSVYTGIEMGFGVFLILCAFCPDLQLAGLLFCVCIYGGLMIVRPISLMHYKNAEKITYLLLITEYLFGIWGIMILCGLCRD